MPRGRPRKNKSEFDDLPNEWKDAVEQSSDEEIRRRVCEVALAEAQNQQNKRDDQDLAEKKLAAKMAGEQYAEATKSNKLKIKFARRILEARGKLS